MYIVIRIFSMRYACTCILETVKAPGNDIIDATIYGDTGLRNPCQKPVADSTNGVTGSVPSYMSR